LGRSGQGLIPRRALETARLVLEPVSTAHADALFDATIASRSELLPWMPWAASPTLEGGRLRAAEGERDWSAGREFHFALIERESGDVLGVAGLNAEGADAYELHYWIRTDRAGRGLTTEAGRALIGFARESLRARRLTLWAGRDNGASRRVAEKLGFRHVGPLGWEPEGGLGPFPAESYELPLAEPV
jgi:RimJ/RimL family protein N-acetyltransferase